ncbi:uncharacterized [Tachysurus ichikawai]
MGGFHSQRTCQVPCFNEFFGLTFGKVCKIPWLMLPQLEWWQWGRPQAFLRTMGSFERAGCPSHCLPVKVCHVWPGSRGALGNLIRAHFRQTVKLGRLVSDSMLFCIEQEKLHGEVCIRSGHQETKTQMLVLIFRGRLFT